MPLLTFPPSPTNGTLYPTNPLAGQTQYQWNATDQTWVIVGTSTGVIPDTYGDSSNVGQFTVDATGRITFAQNVPIASLTGGTVTDVTAGTGLTGGTITSSGTIALANTSVTAGSYINADITVDAQGRITAAANGSAPTTGTLQTVTDNGSTTTNAITAAGITVGDGSLAAPSVSFSSSPDSGFYYDGTNLGIVDDGQIKITVGNTYTTFYNNIQVPSSYSIDMTGTLSFFQSGGNLRFYDFDNSNYVGFRGPSTVTTDVSWVLPDSDGTAGQVLSTNGSGSLGWITPASGVGDLQAVTTAGNTTTNGITVNTLVTTGKAGINGPTGTSTLTVNGTITSDTVTTTGNYQISRGGAAVGLLSGDSGTTSYLPSSFTVAGTARFSSDAYLESGGVLRFYETDNSNFIGLTSPSSLAADVTFTLPATDGTAGQMLTTNGAGTLSWSSSTNYLQQVNVGGTELLLVPTTSNTGFAALSSGGTRTAEVHADGSAYFSTLTSSGLNYPTSDGAAGEVMTTDGAGNLGWLAAAKVVAVPGSQGASGNPGEVAADSSYFYWFDGTNWQRVAAGPGGW